MQGHRCRGGFRSCEVQFRYSRISVNTLIAFGTPDFKVSYVSTNRQHASGYNFAYVLNAVYSSAKSHNPAVCMSSFYRDVKHLSGKNIGCADTSADHSGPCTVEPPRQDLAPAADRIPSHRLLPRQRQLWLSLSQWETDGWWYLRWLSPQAVLPWSVRQLSERLLFGKTTVPSRNCIDIAAKVKTTQIMKENLRWTCSDFEDNRRHRMRSSSL